MPQLLQFWLLTGREGTGLWFIACEGSLLGSVPLLPFFSVSDREESPLALAILQQLPALLEWFLQSLLSNREITLYLPWVLQKVTTPRLSVYSSSPPSPTRPMDWGPKEARPHNHLPLLTPGEL